MRQRKRAAVIQVPLVNGKPDLQLPARAIYKEKGTPFVHLSWTDGDGDVHYGTARRLGTVGSDRVYLCVGTRKILKGLQHLGSKVTLLKDAWQVPARRTWLMNRGVTELNGNPVPPHGFSGDNRVAIGKDED